jgi:dihydroorotate dehydrogenase
MGFYESILRPLAFRLDPETVHHLAFGLLERGLIRSQAFADPRLEQTVLGIRFPNPLGLAAGFDKDARAVNHWHKLGFGFFEVGTITQHAQPGNPKPRLFRLPADRALINRFGFNNQGAEAAAKRLAGSTSPLPFGVNLGKSKITPLESASDDYLASLALLKDFGTYVAINVSSPNTPGLRGLQDKAPLLDLLHAVRGALGSKPLFVKIAPDLEPSALTDIVDVVIQTGVDGVIATNTTLSRAGLKSPESLSQEQGGLSGAPVREKANDVIRQLRTELPAEKVIIGVGGVFTGEDVYEKIALGCHLVQVYTGWIYGGPSMVPTALRQLVARMDREGIQSLGELRGSALS